MWNHGLIDDRATVNKKNKPSMNGQRIFKNKITDYETELTRFNIKWAYKMAEHVTKLLRTYYNTTH